MAVVALGLTACAGDAGEGDTANDATPPARQTEEAEQAAAVAPEHAGDRPEASGAATTEPSVPVDADPVLYGEVEGQEVTGYLARPAELEGPRPGLLVIHEWWGLNDNIRAMTRRLAGEGYVVLAVDLYRGETAETPERARELTAAVDPDLATNNLRQARAHLTERLAASGDLSDKVGVIGWCFGGTWSLRTALAMPDGIDAAVVYYGQPITERERLERLRAPLLGIFGGEDQSIPVEKVRAFESTLQELDKRAEIHIYDGAGHAFANPSGTNYQPGAAREAWSETVDFLSRHLMPASTAASESSANAEAPSGSAAGS